MRMERVIRGVLPVGWKEAPFTLQIMETVIIQA